MNVASKADPQRQVFYVLVIFSDTQIRRNYIGGWEPVPNFQLGKNPGFSLQGEYFFYDTF
jgi:hypothetical protein